ncbi:hypothetical protein ACIBVL_22150 [Streptomyces sp. NPDC049687]
MSAILLTRAEHWLAEAAEAGWEPAAGRLSALGEVLPENPATVEE